MIELKIQKREILGKEVKKLRRKKLIPGVIYGNDYKNQNIQLDEDLFLKILPKCGFNKPLSLELEGKKIKVFIKTLSKENNGKIQHIDFFHLQAHHKMKVDIPIKLVGENILVERGGVLVTGLSQITIECLPEEIPSGIEVNLDKVQSFSEQVTVGDIEFSENIRVLSPAGSMIFLISEIKAEEEEEETEGEEEGEGTEEKSEDEKTDEKKTAE